MLRLGERAKTIRLGLGAEARLSQGAKTIGLGLGNKVRLGLRR